MIKLPVNALSSRKETALKRMPSSQLSSLLQSAFVCIVASSLSPKTFFMDTSNWKFFSTNQHASDY